MSGPRVKICGLTDPHQAAAIAELGVWAIGVVISPESPRAVSARDARRILAPLPLEVARVGVVVGLAPDEAAELVREAGLTHLQLHGRSDPVAVRDNAGVPVIEAFRVDGDDAVAAARASAADLVLLDARVPGLHGGTGRAFDWDLLSRAPLDRPFVLAGGLTPDNVGAAVAHTGPTHVDVSSGVESSPGVKSMNAVTAFVRAAASGRAAA